MDKQHSFHLSHTQSWLTEEDLCTLDVVLLQPLKPRKKTDDKDENACKDLPSVEVKVEQFCNLMSELVGEEMLDEKPDIHCSASADHVSKHLRPRSRNVMSGQVSSPSPNHSGKGFVPEEALMVPESTMVKVEIERHDDNCNNMPLVSRTLHIPNTDAPNVTENALFCQICNMQFLSLNALTSHKKSVSHSKMRHGFACQICTRKFTSIKSLKIHEKKHNKKDNIYCVECDKEFLYEVDLRKHELAKHNIKSLTCSKCSKLFLSTYYLKKHEEICGLNRFECEICEKAYPMPSMLKVHKISHSEDRPYECETCGQKCKTEVILRKHKKTHNPDRILPCAECKEMFANLRELKLHQCKALSKAGPPDVKPFMCAVCQVGFKEKLMLVEHMELHAGRRSLLLVKQKEVPTCSVCGLEMSSSWKVKRHEKSVHSIKKPFACGLCTEKFETGSDLSKHKKGVHAELHRYMCGICKKTFHILQILEKHLVIHFDDRPFKCTTCESSFKRECHLREHMAVHDGEKNFTCQHCGNKYLRNHQLRVHMKTHDVKQFICKVCNKAFTHKRDLEIHTNSHSKEKPFKCMRCGAGYSRKSLLQTHLLKQH